MSRIPTPTDRNVLSQIMYDPELRKKYPGGKTIALLGFVMLIISLVVVSYLGDTAIPGFLVLAIGVAIILLPIIGLITLYRFKSRNIIPADDKKKRKGRYFINL